MTDITHLPEHQASNEALRERLRRTLADLAQPVEIDIDVEIRNLVSAAARIGRALGQQRHARARGNNQGGASHERPE